LWCIRSKTGEIRTIILKRRLDGSLTVYGEVRENMEIEVMLNRLANYWICKVVSILN
jgi:hypothetical protein